ncbi:MAG: sigma-E factor negative regulatory protein RseC [Thiomicrorhabdus sp.]|nr:MAG: sigma-E factor negative regulatory protein RseC [Thiomicrorhabdus sp.]
MSIEAQQKLSENLLTEQGEIVSLEGEFAFVQVQKESGCSGCASAKSCGTSALSNYFNSGTRGLIKVVNSESAQLGDFVELTLDESKLVKQAFMAYGIPLLGLFIFAVLFKLLALHSLGLDETYQDVFSIIGGFSGVAVGWFFTHKAYQPVLPIMTQISTNQSKGIEL